MSGVFGQLCPRPSISVISLTRPSVNNPNPIMQSERAVLEEQAIVSKKGGTLLPNLLQSSRSTFSRGSFLSFFAFGSVPQLP
jgi:hypothetical protein